MKSRYLLALCLLLVSFSSHGIEKRTSNGYNYFIDSPPTWVKPDTALNNKTSNSKSSGAVEELLTDNQVNLLGTSSSTYLHQQRRAKEINGLEEVSQLRLPFNPSYETLTLHDIAVIRDGKRESRIKTVKVDLLRREEKLEQKMVDGQVTAVIVLPDIRLGDIVETAYTISGDNPVFGGKYSGFFSLGYDRSVTKLSLRVLYPATRPIKYDVLKSNIQPTINEQAGIKTLSITANDTDPVRQEEGTPKWIKIYPEINLTDFADWKEVNRWAYGHFSNKGDYGLALTKVIEQIKNSGQSEEAKIIKALHFVQEEIRYFGVEIGASSHRPKLPQQTLEQRYGDCKDKTVLLIAMLNELGFRARPALVSFMRGKGIEKRLATPLMFDHVITALEFNNKTYWLDATASYQGDKLDTLGQEPFGFSLLVDGESDRLTPVTLQDDYRNEWRFIHHFDVVDYKSPVKLTTTRQLSGAPAEALRRYIAAQGLDNLAKDNISQLSRAYQGIQAADAPVVRDNREENRLEVVFSYRLDDFFLYENGEVKRAWSPIEMSNMLILPRETNRTMPLALMYPAAITQRIEMSLPQSPDITLSQGVNVYDPHFTYSARPDLQKNLLGVEFRFKHLRDSVELSQFTAYLDKLKQMQKYMGFNQPIPLTSKDQQTTWKQQVIARYPALRDEPDSLTIMMARNEFSQLQANAVIQAGMLTNRALATAYQDKATALSLLGRKQEALNDLSMAQRLDPERDVQTTYAEIYQSIGQFDLSLAALEKRPKTSAEESTLDIRAINLYYAGRYAEAKKVSLKAVEESSGDEQLHNLLWLYYITTRHGEAGQRYLKQYGDNVDPAQWPAPAIAFFQDKISAEQLLAQASKERKNARLNLCEAYFYIGQYHLLKQNHVAAREAFKKALETQAVMYREYSFSQEELRRLEK